MIKRRAFLVGLGGGPFAVPELIHGQTTASTPGSPTLVSANQGLRLWVLGAFVTIKVDSKTTGGSYSLFEDLVPPGQGVPPHVHTREDETVYVLEGELALTVGDQKIAARPGDFVHMPRGVPHQFRNVSQRPARMVLSYAPGGYEQFFVDIGTPVTDPQAPAPPTTPEAIQRAKTVALRYGVTLLV